MQKSQTPSKMQQVSQRRLQGWRCNWKHGYLSLLAFKTYYHCPEHTSNASVALQAKESPIRGALQEGLLSFVDVAALLVEVSVCLYELVWLNIPW